jgi:lipopolysaccharide export LptBFGC system permease protein LptF
MKKLMVIVVALLMAAVTAMAQNTVKPAEAPKKEAVESRFKDMTLLQLLEEVRKGRDADIQKYLSENQDFRILSGYTDVKEYRKNELLEKEIAKVNRLNINRWKNADRKVFGYSIKKENADAYAVCILLFARERNAEFYSGIKSNLMMNNRNNVVLANLGFRIVLSYLTTKQKAWDRNKLRDAMDMYQSGVSLYVEDQRRRRVGEDWKFAERDITLFNEQEKPGQTQKK